MLLFLSLTGIILSIILLYFNARKYASSIYLGSFFLLVSLYGLILYALIYSGSLTLIAIAYVNPTFLTYLIGPMIYWYVRSVITDDSRLKKRDLWHLVPAMIFLLTSLPYMFSPWQEKITHATEIVDNIRYVALNKPTGLYVVVPHLIIFLSRPVLVLFYTIWSAILMIRHVVKKMNSSVFLHQRYMISWLTVLLGFLFILSFSQLILLGEAYLNRDSTWFFTYNLLTLLSTTGLTGLLVSPFFFPGILYGMPRYPENKFSEGDISGMVFLSNKTEKKRIPGFESEYLDQVGKKLDSCMSEQQPFLQPECNLASVSKCIEVPVHHLAYYFREVKGQSFNDYRNALRVDHAKKLIREGRTKDMTLEGIGLSSGFSTRNTFFTAFKKAEGISPGAYSSKVTDG